MYHLNAGSEPAAELLLEVLLRVPTRVAGTLTQFTPVLSKLAVARNYQLWATARQLLMATGQSLPTINKQSLPVTYRLQFTGTVPGQAGTNAASPRELVRPFGDSLARLAAQAGLRPGALYYRAGVIMAELDDPAHWTDAYQQTVGSQLRATRLKYKLTWPRVMTARRALLHVVTELLDAGALSLSAVATAGLPLPDYQAYAFPEVAKPACVHPLQRERYGHLAKEWVGRVEATEQIQEASLSVYRPGWLVIGEDTQLRSLDWNAATENYQCQLTASEESNEEGIASLDLVFNCPTATYYDLQPGPGSIIIEREQLNLLTRQSAWLAFNPALAKSMG